MKMGDPRKAFFAVLLMAAASGLLAADHYRLINGPKDFYFGHISYLDPAPGGTAPSVLRAGAAAPETAVLNLPIGPGDTIRTSDDRRCEIQFDTGTIVRLDVGTSISVQTILARSLSSAEELSVLALDRGRVYVMYKQYSGQEMFQVLTPNAAIKMKHNGVAILTAAADGSTEAQVVFGQARVLFGPEPARLDERRVRKGERLMVLADHQSETDAAITGTAFELWNKEINARFEDLHEGLSSLPKPVQNLPKAVFYFAQAYGNRYGEWLWDDLFGYVWRPYIDNGRYPWGWSPYFYGSWTYAAGQLFWVPQEPWGWVPYHLGIWQWDKKLGWVWLPGSLFAPAWATWDFFFGYACWRPWSLFDWMSGFGPYWATGFRLMNDGWWYSVPIGPQPNLPGPVRTVVRKDALKQPSGPGAMPVPGELKAVVRKATAGYERGDAGLREAAAAVPRQLVFVDKTDLASGAIHERSLTFDQVLKRADAPATGRPAPVRIADPRREAALIFRTQAAAAAAAGRVPDLAVETGPRRAVSASPAVRGNPAPGGPGRPFEAPVRFRDWNPDLRLARELGVRIEYSSLRNEVRCPELNLSSRDRERPGGLAPRLTSRGVGLGPSVSSGGSSSGGSTGSGATGTSTGTSMAAPTRGSASSGTPAKSEGGGKIKN